MKYKVKNNLFAMGMMCKAGTVIEIDPKDEHYFKGQIEPIEAPAKPKKKKGGE
jgi:hypothetical protein